jgi:hypothetical protein
VALVDDLIVQVEQSIDPGIPMHDLAYHLLIQFASLGVQAAQAVSHEPQGLVPPPPGRGAAASLGVS